MNREKIFYTIMLAGGLLLSINTFCQENQTNEKVEGFDVIQLMSPVFSSNTSIEEALLHRRSIRNYRDEPLKLQEISQILWAAQGITDKTYGFRTAPSAGALYPVEIYLVSGNVEDVPAGIYKYKPHDHAIKKLIGGDKRNDISNAALRQNAITNSSAIIIISAAYERTAVKYGDRTERYVHIEVGHVGQNIYLQSFSLGIGSVMIGAFKDSALKKVLQIPDKEHPLAIMPLGKI